VIDDTVEFPTEYYFKFIVPINKLSELLHIMAGMAVEEKTSQNGNYVSVSGRKVMHTSQEIIDVYQKASVIKGIISL
jgi:hypothetical protein